jgi:hypothetical protein
MRLTLIIATVIFTALLTYARLLAVAQNTSRPVPYEGVVSAPALHAGLVSTQSN